VNYFVNFWWLWLLVALVALVLWFAIWRYRRSREA